MNEVSFQKKFNLVLDLDSTLVHTNNINDDFMNINLYHHTIHHKVRSFSIDNNNEHVYLWTIFRPYLKEFLDFCSKYFKNVYIWSAGQYKYVHIIKDLIYTDIHVKPDVIYTYDDCIISNNNIFKPLDKMFRDIQVPKDVNVTNTFVIDDRLDTFSHNPGNGILIPIYEPRGIHGIQNDTDDCLVKLMGWFISKEVMNATDVRSINKNNIFTTSMDEYLQKIK